MCDNVSETARYGGLTRGQMVINDETKTRMKKVLKDIKSEKFAKEWLKYIQRKKAAIW